jgi:hypothetical protein
MWLDLDEIAFEAAEKSYHESQIEDLMEEISNTPLDEDKKLQRYICRVGDTRPIASNLQARIMDNCAPTSHIVCIEFMEGSSRESQLAPSTYFNYDKFCRWLCRQGIDWSAH